MINSREKKRLIAVVDDHEPFRTGICALLERHGYRTCHFESVPRFIASGAMLKIDCLVLDIAMPEIDGLALHDCLRHTNYEFPILLCTGSDRDARIESALANGAAGLIQKPVKSETLLEAIASACAAHPPRSG